MSPNPYLSIHFPNEALLPKEEVLEIAELIQEVLEAEHSLACEISCHDPNQGFYLVFKDFIAKDDAQDLLDSINEDLDELETLGFNKDPLGNPDRLDRFIAALGLDDEEECDCANCRTEDDEDEAEELPIDLEIVLLALGEYIPQNPQDLQNYLANYDGSDNPPAGWEPGEWGGPFEVNNDEAEKLYIDVVCKLMESQFQS